MLEAVVKSAGESRWNDFLPEFRVLPSIRQVGAEELTEAVHPLPASAPFEAREKLQVAGERRRALLLFRHGFPPEISKPVGRIPVEQWRILRLLRREPAMLDLLPVNPALVFAVAVALRGPLGSRLPPGFAKMRQRELAHDLGFPDSAAVVRVLRKVCPVGGKPG
jgi:hypothetical protein